LPAHLPFLGRGDKSCHGPAPAAAQQVARIRDKARLIAPDSSCPLLENGAACSIQPDQLSAAPMAFHPRAPVRRGNHRFLSQKLSGVASLPGHAIIDLDQLNATLAAINAVFVKEFLRIINLKKSALPLLKRCCGLREVVSRQPVALFLCGN